MRSRASGSPALGKPPTSAPGWTSASCCPGKTGRGPSKPPSRRRISLWPAIPGTPSARKAGSRRRFGTHWTVPGQQLADVHPGAEAGGFQSVGEPLGLLRILFYIGDEYLRKAARLKAEAIDSVR